MRECAYVCVCDKMSVFLCLKAFGASMRLGVINNLL